MNSQEYNEHKKKQHKRKRQHKPLADPSDYYERVGNCIFYDEHSLPTSGPHRVVRTTTKCPTIFSVQPPIIRGGSVEDSE